MTTRDFGDGLAWRKSSRSDSTGACLYVACDGRGMIGVRDSKQGRGGRLLWHTQAEWNAFIAGVKHGEFDI